MSELVKSEATLTRNGVTVPLYIGEFGKLSKENKGLKFRYPIMGVDTFDTDTTMIGKDFIAETMTKTLRRIFGAIQVASWDKDTGEVDTDAWQQAAQDFTEGEEKRDIIEGRLMVLSERVTAITDLPEFMENPEKFSAQVKEIGDASKLLAAELKAIQVKIDEKTAKRNATKAANAEALAAKQAKLKEAKAAVQAMATAQGITVEQAQARIDELAEQQKTTATV